MGKVVTQLQRYKWHDIYKNVIVRNNLRSTEEVSIDFISCTCKNTKCDLRLTRLLGTFFCLSSHNFFTCPGSSVLLFLLCWHYQNSFILDLAWFVNKKKMLLSFKNKGLLRCFPRCQHKCSCEFSFVQVIWRLAVSCFFSNQGKSLNIRL